MAAVYYKFKSAKKFDSIPIEGQYISVAFLKRLIFAKHLGKGKDFDIKIFNASTNEEYVDEAALICKQTAVLIQRVPGLPQKRIVVERKEPKVDDNKSEELPPPNRAIVNDSTTMKYPEESEWNEFVKDLSSITELQPMESNKPVVHVSAASKIDEDEKIKALVETPALNWNCHGHKGYGGGRGFGRGMGAHLMSGHGFETVLLEPYDEESKGDGSGRGGFERKTPPTGYVCHRCRVPGHFIQHCPTNGDPNYDSKRMKPPSGIPKSMLMESSDGCYALPSGVAAVLKPNEAAFEKEIGGIPSGRHVDLPPELRCPLCKEVMKDAVLTGKCCFRSFCNKCIRDYIVTKKICACGATNVLSDDLVPNKTLRDTISRIMESATSSSENVGSLEHVQDVESAHHVQHRVSSSTQDAASRGEHNPFPIDHSSDVKKGDTGKVEDASEVKVVNDDEKHYLDKKTAKGTDASEATPESTGPQEIISHETLPMPEEKKEKSVGDKGKKKRKKTEFLPESAVDLGTEACAGVSLAPSTFYPWWAGGMPVGIDGCMTPFAANFSYMGYPSGFSDGTFGVIQPKGPFPAQYYMTSTVLPREHPKDSSGMCRDVNNSHGGADDSSVKTKLRSQEKSSDMDKVTNLQCHDHSSSPQMPSKRRRPSDVQEDDRAGWNHKSSVSHRPSFSGFCNENGSSNKRREYLSRFEQPNDPKDHHKSYRTSNNYHRKTSYENKASEYGEEEKEERHFKRRPSWSSAMRPEIAIT